MTSPSSAHRIYRGAIAAAVSTLCFAAQARAQTPNPPPDKSGDAVVNLDAFNVTSTNVESYDETTTSAASKIAMNMMDVSATMQVLNKNFIEDKVALTLEDLYSYVVGMNRESPAGAGFTLRGFSGNTTTSMINIIQFDGLPGAPSRNGSPSTANIERVEVLKGPSSVLYGAMNPGGLVNLVSKSPSAVAASSIFAAYSSYAGQNAPLGDHGGGTVTFDSTGPIDAGKHFLYRFIASYEDVPTFRQFDWGRNYYIYPSLTYRLDQNTELTVKLEFDREHRFSIEDQSLAAPFNLIANVPKDHTIVYQDPNSPEYDRGDVYAAFLKHNFDNGLQFHFSIRTLGHTDGRQLLENFNLTSAIPVDQSTETQRYRNTFNRRRYTYWDTNLTKDFGKESFKNTILIGASGGYETYDFVRYVYGMAAGPMINLYHPVHNLTTYPVYNPLTGPTQMAVAKYYNYAAYAEDQIKIGSHLHASAGVHAEKYRTSYYDYAIKNGAYVNPGAFDNVSAVVPSFGLVYQPVEMLSTYASYSESFKPSIPQAVDGYNHPFKPEKANQIEVGSKADLFNHKVTVDLALYDITRSNVSEVIPTLTDANGVSLYRQQSEKSKGVELSINYQPVPYYQMQIGYGYDDAYVSASLNPTEIDARLTNAPRNSFNFWNRYNVPNGVLRGFGVGFGVIYTGMRNGLLVNNLSNALVIPSNTRADLALYYKWRHYDFAINTTNIFDESYIASADATLDAVPGDPRKITVSVRYSF